MNGLLERVMYDLTQAHHLLGVPRSTLDWWLEGRRAYKPVLRTEPTGSKYLTWGEFVEAWYVKEYRREHGVGLDQIRHFIEHLRNELGAPYPLATTQPWVGPGRKLLLKAQQEVELDPDLWPVWEPTTGQFLLTAPAQSFINRVEFGDEYVQRLYPVGPKSPVVIDPNLRGGLASVDGIATAVLLELHEAGETIESIADDFGLKVDVAMAAVVYERTLDQAA